MLMPTAKGDWLLYGHHVHKTQSMRNRRRIFNIIDQLDFQYKIKAAKTGYIFWSTRRAKSIIPPNSH